MPRFEVPAARVNTLPVVPVQLVPEYQVTVPVLPEEAVNTAPVVTPLDRKSVVEGDSTLVARARAPAVKVRGEEMTTSLLAAPATTDSSWVPEARMPEAKVAVGGLASVSVK